MSEITNLPALIDELSVATIESNFEEMETRSGKAVKALTAIQEINTDEEDEKAEQMLVKVRKTFVYIENMRKAMTGPLDEIKKALMEPEKQITNAPGAGNEYERVKKLRDAYANKKYLAEQERQKEIERNRKVEAERTRVRSIFKTNFSEGIVQANILLNTKLSEAFQGTTLETIETLKTKLSKGARLYEQVYIDWFDPMKVQSTLEFADIKKISEEVQKELTFQQACEEYEKVSTPTMDAWRDRVPELEKTLSLGAEKAREAAKKMAQEMAAEEEKRNAQALKEAQERAEAEAKAAQLQTEFKSQIQMQTGAIETKGTVKRRAVIEADTQDFVAVISELFFNVFIHPKYTGIMKKDKKGQVQYNEDGSPIYVDWLQGLLDFYAANCQDEIPGIKIVEEVKTTQRGK